MRVSAVAICTLAALSGKELTQAAIASPALPELPDDSLTSDVAASAVAVIEPVVSVAPPEVVLEPAREPSFPAAAAAEALPPIALESSVAPPEAMVLPERSTLPAAPMTAPAPIAAADGLASLSLETEPIAAPAPIAVPAAPVVEPVAVAAAAPELPPTSYRASDLLSEGAIVAQVTPPAADDVEDLQRQLEEATAPIDFGDELEGAPAITISNPSGYGADDFTGFVQAGFQSRTRFGDVSDGALGFGMGFGDARRNVGVQLSYTLASFGGSREFGAGGFNAKLHRQFPGGLSVAAGWDGFITTGDVDFEDSIYGVATQIIRTRPDIDDPFSRIALTAGVGSGRFRSEADFVDDNDTVGVFGSVAVRVARPVSVIAEWTGQDLAIGASVAPFRDFPLVITPALRDITGAGDGARFVLGLGVSFQL